MGTAATSAGAAGPSEGLRAGRSSGWIKPEYTAASGPRDYGSGPTTGTRSQTTCYVRRGTDRVVHCTMIERFFSTIGQLIAAWDQRLNPLNDNS